MRFEEGKITEYSCDNFENPQEGKALIRQQIMKNHDTLAMGEFAIGTNTAAYAMARRFGIVEKLPILIERKWAPTLQWEIPVTAGARIRLCTIQTERKSLRGIMRYR